MINTYSGGKPGSAGPDVFAPNIEVFYQSRDLANFMAAPVTIDGNLSNNTNNAPYGVYLFAGTVLGRVTQSLNASNGGLATTPGKYANSIIGLTTAALGGSQTSLSVTPSAAAEIVRRFGTSGTFTLTGPPATGGVVRSRTVTYSAVNPTTGVVTLSADLTSGSSAVNAVFATPFVDSTGSGTFTITIEGITTGAIAYSSTAATLVSNINTALNAVFGSGSIVASGSSLAAIILTGTANGYAGRAIGLPTFTLLVGATGFTAGPATVTTAGSAAVVADGGEFVASSLVQPTDGSQAPITVICDAEGVKVADATNLNRVDAFCPQLLAGGAGVLNDQSLQNWPTDPTTLAWAKAQLKAACSGVTFLSDQTG